MRKIILLGIIVLSFVSKSENLFSNKDVESLIYSGNTYYKNGEYDKAE